MSTLLRLPLISAIKHKNKKYLAYHWVKGRLESSSTLSHFFSHTKLSAASAQNLLGSLIDFANVWSYSELFVVESWWWLQVDHGHNSRQDPFRCKLFVFFVLFFCKEKTDKVLDGCVKTWVCSIHFAQLPNLWSDLSRLSVKRAVNAAIPSWTLTCLRVVLQSHSHPVYNCCFW